MLTLFLNTLITALSLLVVDLAIPGVELNNFWDAMIAALIIGLVNNTIRPVLSFVSFPINFLTLGLFSLVVNGFCFWLASQVSPGFVVAGPLAFFLGPVILSFATTVLNNFFEERGMSWSLIKNRTSGGI